MTDPDVLLLDEPLAALDAPTKARIIDDLRKWNEAHRFPFSMSRTAAKKCLRSANASLCLSRTRFRTG